MPKLPPDDRSPLAIGYAWSVIVSSIGLEMALPPLFGFWIDQKCGTLVLFTILGAILGMTSALIHLVQIGKQFGQSGKIDRLGKTGDFEMGAESDCSDGSSDFSNPSDFRDSSNPSDFHNFDKHDKFDKTDKLDKLDKEVQ